MSSFNWPGSGSSNGVPIYASFAALPGGTNAGDLAVTADTGNLYEWSGSAWQQIAGPGAALSLGAFGSTPNANGLSLSGAGVLIMQPADGTHPGGVSISAQTMAGVKTFSSAPNLSSLSASLPLQLDASKNIVALAIDLSGTQATGILAAARFPALTGDITTASGAVATTLATVNSNVGSFTNASITVNGKGLITAASSGTTGNLTDTGTDGITVTGGTGAVLGSGTSLAQHVADVSHNGYLSSTDWGTFNSKQTATLTSAHILVGNVSNVATDVAMSGDISLSNAGATAIVATTNATLTTISSLVSVGTISTGTWSATTIAVNKGGTGVTSVTTAPAATAWAGWDANKNMSANNLLDGYRTTATGAGTTTLVVGDAGLQYFTGSTTQTVLMPVTSTLVAGFQYTIVNLSSGVVTVQSSGSNTIQAMAANTTLILTVVDTSVTTAAGWKWIYQNVNGSIPMINPMDGAGQMIYGGTAGAPTKVVAGTSGQVPISAGTTVAFGTLQGNATALKAPTVQRLTSTGTTTGYLFTISTSTTCAVGDTYTNNSNTYTVLGALSAQSGTVLFMSQASAPQASGTLTRSAGAGTSSITFSANIPLATYTAPTSPAPLSVKIKTVGAGGAGSGSGTGSCGAGGTGGSTYFGANILIAAGAAGGIVSSGTPTAGGAGGAATVNSPAVTSVALTGGSGCGKVFSGTANGIMGGYGADSPFGGAGKSTGSNVAGETAIANTGSGGQGGGVSSGTSGVGSTGGGAGGYIEAFIGSPSATYPYAIGAGGTAGSAGTSGQAGGAGAAGIIIVEEYYQ